MQTLKILFSIVFIISALGNSMSVGPKNIPPTTQPPLDTMVQHTDPKKLHDTAAKIQNSLPIDTALNKIPQQTVVQIDTIKKIDSTLIEPVPENALTNTKLFIYILLSVLGLGLFFFIFVINLFKTFHKKKSTRQSLLLSWNLFFIISIIWIFIIWGLVAGFWTSASFMIVVIFLFIISLIMTIIAIKSK
jgi:hypothetical protein